MPGRNPEAHPRPKVVVEVLAVTGFLVICLAHRSSPNFQDCFTWTAPEAGNRWTDGRGMSQVRDHTSSAFSPAPGP